MTNAASAQALEEFKKRLREFLESSETGRQAIAMSGREEIEMDRLRGDGKTRGGSRVESEDDDE